MSWILGVVGAVLGLLIADGSREGFGLIAGALIGALLGMALRSRRRIFDLEERLARVEMLGRRPTATAAPAATPAPASPDAPPPPAAPAAPAAPAPSQVPPVPTDWLSGAPLP
ncbi:MAG: hypothetical protein U1E00_02715, partial [Pseudoxanthomonas sp.]|nr:hypothetical protein [Pseudoxanthomonas sp.]